MKSIAIIVCTRRKNRKLIKFLKSIKNLKSNFRVKLIIIENNINKTLKKKDFNNLRFNKKIKILYHLETKKGIAHARNKGLDILNNLRTDFVGFFDDDCEISKDWLINMFKVQNKYNLDILTGPQISKSKKIYFKALERNFKHLAQVNWAATNNVFMKKKNIG